MENNRIKPDILSNESLLRRNLEATAPPFFEELQPDVQKGIRGKNRGREIRRDTDKIQDTSINLQDIDETIKYYLEERLNLSVLSNGESIKVPIIYGAGEKWLNVQANGFYRDRNGKIQTPLIMFKRNSVEKRREIGNKLDGNRPNLYITEQNRYSKKNVYDNFNLLNNIREPIREIYQVPIPDYVFLNYEAIIWTDFLEQNNKLVEAIEYVSDSYWGDPERHLFQTNVDAIQNVNELQVGEDRLVRATFNFKVAAYLLPDTFLNETQANKKQFTPSTIELNIQSETVVNNNTHTYK